MANVKKFEDLKIWQDARILVGTVYSIMKANKDFGFRDQIQRASVSIMNNIAEGFERNSDAEFKRFLDIAKASAGEVRSMLYLAEDLNYITKEKAKELRESASNLSGAITNLMKYLRKQ